MIYILCTEVSADQMINADLRKVFILKVVLVEVFEHAEPRVLFAEVLGVLEAGQPLLLLQVHCNI